MEFDVWTLTKIKCQILAEGNKNVDHFSKHCHFNFSVLHFSWKFSNAIQEVWHLALCSYRCELFVLLHIHCEVHVQRCLSKTVASFSVFCSVA
jgi:hypothetical protein